MLSLLWHINAVFFYHLFEDLGFQNREGDIALIQTLTVEAETDALSIHGCYSEHQRFPGKFRPHSQLSRDL